jgi:hypothetical protein
LIGISAEENFSKSSFSPQPALVLPYVADSSLFPTASGINPSWTIMALSHRVSSQLAKSLS